MKAKAENNQKFVDKQNRLNAALEKVRAHLQYLIGKYHDRTVNFQSLKGKEKKEVDTWNDWHDLQDRIENRLIDNYQEAQRWHFKKFGWAVLKD
jgi:hypothetical protein